MLQRAPTASAEIRTGRENAIRARRQHLDQVGPLASHRSPHALAGQGQGCEDRPGPNPVSPNPVSLAAQTARLLATRAGRAGCELPRPFVLQAVGAMLGCLRACLEVVAAGA